MEFRTEARVSLILLAAACAAGSQTVDVRHGHRDAQLQATADGISFTERDKVTAWKYADIERLELTPDMLSVLTYQNRKYVFTSLPDGFANQVYGQWRDRLDQRFIAALPDPNVKEIWQAPAKLLGWHASNGRLLVGADRIVYETGRPSQSRTWRYADIDNIASAGPFDFSVVTAEREFRFQLKQSLPESRYNQLWRRMNTFKEQHQ